MIDKPAPAAARFPQLSVARDPARMGEILRRHLQPLKGKAFEVQECAIGIGYPRGGGGNSWAQMYIVRLREPGTGRERSQVVTGVMHSGDRTRHLWEELRRSDPEPAVLAASRAFPPYFYVPDLDMLVLVFPYDHRLPALARLMAGPPPQFAPLLLEWLGPGDWSVEAWEAKTVRYRAEQRATVRVTARARDAATGRAEERRFYAKVYPEDQDGEQVYRLVRALWDKAGAAGADFTVGRPLAYLSSLRILLQDEVPGPPLEALLDREDELIPAVRLAARASAALHLSNLAVPQRHLLRTELARMENVGDVLRSAYPLLRRDIEAIVRAVVAGLDEVPLAPTHGELRPAHILLDGDRLALVDLDRFAAADPMLDVATFLVHLGNLGPHVHRPGDRRRVVTRAFVEEYFAHAPIAWRTRLPLRYAMAVLTSAARVSRRGSTPDRPDTWPGPIEGFLEEARDALAGRVW